jgi:hypothetical protein
MREAKDRSGKWLLDHHGDAVLRLGGLAGFSSWRPARAGVVHPRQMPDGLLEVSFPGRPGPDPVVVEIATYPERRAEEQALRDALLVFLERQTLPEVLTLVLHPKGNFRLGGDLRVSSAHGLVEVSIRWRVVELWTLPAEDLLAAGDVGLVPWVPLASTAEAPEVLLRRCRERIEEQAPPAEKENLLAVAQVLAGLRYNSPLLLAILGGRETMIESPVLTDLVNYATRAGIQKTILSLLQQKFGSVPADIEARVRAVQEEERLLGLAGQVESCPDLDSFRARLPA